MRTPGITDASVDNFTTVFSSLREQNIYVPLANGWGERIVEERKIYESNFNEQISFPYSLVSGGLIKF